MTGGAGWFSSGKKLAISPLLRAFSDLSNSFISGAAMANAQVPRIHPTAIVSPEAELADDVVIGPYVVIEGMVRIGPGCVLRPHVHLCGTLTMGRNNHVYTGAVLGERPQHLPQIGRASCRERV